MRRNIKNSLSVKVFCWVFSALAICSMLIYGMVLTVLPKQYQFISDRKLEENMEVLVSDLRNMGYDDAIKEIYNFCIQHNVAAMLSNEEGVLYFGAIKAEEMETATANIGAMVSFLGSETEYTFVISCISQVADEISGLMLRFLPVVFVAILLLSFLSAFICSKVIVSPIAEISRVAKQMTLSDMAWECDKKSSDEISVLASSLNTMASRLKSTMEELENANQHLAADVEKFRALEEQRRNFFAAVSHELKTPLTILKGQIENMMLGYGDYQNHEKYLPEALRTTEDREYLIKEIIAITKLESMDLRNSLEDISLRDSVNKAVETLLPLAKDKDIQIHQRIGTDMMLSVNSNLWNKVLSNVIGNAVRHSPSGEEVFISLQSDGTGTALVVKNTGTLIPETDLPHMFTPFYRVDSSRSRATGGNGLGLYIVKTILDLHHMTYRIGNTQNGVVFFVYLNE